MPARSTLLAVCVTGSVALHLGLALGLGMPPAEPAAGSATAAHRPRLQMVTATQAPGSTRPLAPVPTPAVRRLPASTGPVARAWPDLDHLPPTSAGTPASSPARTDGLQAATDHDRDAAADGDYLPRDQLTRGPVPQQSIDLVYPDLAPVGQFRTVLTLFIDDQGVVRRVRFDEADETGLPPVLEEAARQTFLRSTFTPGELDGRPIRSRLRIEVAYTAETPAATR